MSTRFVRRGSSLVGLAGTPNSNSVRVDSASEVLKFGTGASGTTEKTAVDTTSTQTLTNKTLTSPTITGPIGPAPTPTTGNLVLTAALHAGKTLIHNEAVGRTYTLPAATGTGNKYRIVVGVTLTSASLVVAVPNGTDFFRGRALFQNDADGTASNFETANTGTVATESDTATLNRTTTGLGTIGDELTFEDIGAAVWLVRIEAQASGAEATPFSAAV
jgi:hypothetical protein